MFKKTISFPNVLKQLQKKETFKDYVDKISLLLESVSLLMSTPISGTTPETVVLTATATSVCKILSPLLKKIIDNRKDFASVSEQMEAAYATICYTAFFDTLKDKLPSDILDGIDLLESEKKDLFNQTSTPVSSDICGEIIKPDIVYGIDESKGQLKRLYDGMLQRLSEFLESLAYVENANIQIRETIEKVFRTLAEEAVQQFEKQYYELCLSIPQFYSYISLKVLSEQYSTARKHRNEIEKLILSEKNDIEAGFKDLVSLLTSKEWIVSCDRILKQEKVKDAANTIIERAKMEIANPIFGNADQSESDELVFPSIEEAFIPQSFKSLIYHGPDQHLENSDEWNARPDEDNQAAFWAKYFNDPDSENHILLILGEPGIGKSLMTKVISARIGALGRMIIRISLRNADMEKTVEKMILEQINKDGDVDEPFPSLKYFSQFFTEEPITVFFDGYDEFQQATGLVYREFLEKLSTFQKECKDNGRPIRIVVTSRATLIDKARIPIGTVVLQLNEFDDTRKKAWIKIWNKANKDIFKENNLAKFSLPKNSEEIDKLSGQPLLLLMLAIYDANLETKQNALSENTTIVRTQLYNELIRRFIRRELAKGQRGDEMNYSELDKKGQDEFEEREMKQLGTAALGMFVRGKLTISVQELKEDLTRLNAPLKRYSDVGKPMLENEEAFFGSFFFIHDPRPNCKDKQEYKCASFEFLHKTFYEFLVADVVLSCVHECISVLLNDKLDSESNAHRLSDYKDHLEKIEREREELLLVSSGTCLCSEPVIIEMMAEWAENRLWRDPIKEDCKNTVKTVFSDLVKTHAEMVKEGSFVVNSLSKGCLLQERTLPQIYSTYLLNILTTTVIACSSFELDEALWKYTSRFICLNLPEEKKQDGSETKEKALHFDVSPSDEIILRFISHISVSKNDEKTLFQLREDPVELESLDLLAGRMEVFTFLCEEEQKTVYSIHRRDYRYHLKADALNRLSDKGMNINNEIMFNKLCSKMIDFKFNYELEPIVRVLAELLNCNDTVFVQKSLNSILPYISIVVDSGRIVSQRAFNDIFELLDRISERFRFKGIQYTITSIHKELAKLIEVEKNSFQFWRSNSRSPKMLRSDIRERLISSDKMRYVAVSPCEYNQDMISSNSGHRSVYRNRNAYLDYNRNLKKFRDRSENLTRFIEVASIAKYFGDYEFLNILLHRSVLGKTFPDECVSSKTLLELYLLLNDYPSELRESIQCIFGDSFEDFYRADPESAATVFCEISHTFRYSKDALLGKEGTTSISDMGHYIIYNYAWILEQSFPIAILVLMTCIRLSLESDELCDAIRMCFNMFIFDHRFVYVDRMIDLVDTLYQLELKTIESLFYYFHDNFARIDEANNSVAQNLLLLYKKKGIILA